MVRKRKKKKRKNRGGRRIKKNVKALTNAMA